MASVGSVLRWPASLGRRVSACVSCLFGMQVSGLAPPPRGPLSAAVPALSGYRLVCPPASSLGCFPLGGAPCAVRSFLPPAALRLLGCRFRARSLRLFLLGVFRPLSCLGGHWFSRLPWSPSGSFWGLIAGGATCSGTLRLPPLFAAGLGSWVPASSLAVPWFLVPCWPRFFGWWWCVCCAPPARGMVWFLSRCVRSFAPGLFGFAPCRFGVWLVAFGKLCFGMYFLRYYFACYGYGYGYEWIANRVIVSSFWAPVWLHLSAWRLGFLSPPWSRPHVPAVLGFVVRLLVPRGTCGALVPLGLFLKLSFER